MGAEVTTAVHITCDNPACPGNSLDPASYDGWIQMQAQVTVPNANPEFPSFPVFQNAVYCSPSCAGSVGTALEDAAAARALAANPVSEEPVEEEAPARPRARGKK